MIPQHYDVPLADIVTQLQLGHPIAFSRWGDGEWSAILGKPGHNCDGHPYSNELQRDLTQVLEDEPGYYLGMQNAALRRYGPEIEAWLAVRKLDLQWAPSDLWHHASMRDQLGPFIEVLASRGVILVGPARLKDLTIFPIRAHVETPLVDCHQVAGRILAETRDALNGPSGGPGAVVSLSASMSANYLVHELQCGDPDATLLDLGSLWEPYVGVANRAYHHDVIRRLREQRP